ncbi:MAG: histidine phosphatase family protein, partial [Candidatus Omnitrophota bacterium]
MTRLLLIRHGETKYNLNRCYCGLSDPPLNASGISQAESLSGQLKDFDIALVYSSDLKRTMQTAEIVFPVHQIKTMPEFREFNFGVFEGLNYTEIAEKYPGFYHDWLINPLHVSIPKGERFTDFKNRVNNALSLVISLNRNKTIALVTHSGPIRLILCEV